ncbi:MAG: hypothetical protein HXL35_09610 [Prevotellaceae bacterium]|nr:hypothetical protein [Prevotellaceae bacterium]
MTAVSSTYDGCRMMGVTAAIRSADGRRTFNLTMGTKKQNKGNKETEQRKYSSKTAKTKKKYNVIIETKQQKVTTITR